MDEFERKIAQALRADEAEQFERLGAEALPWEALAQTLRGRNRWLNLLCGVWILIFLAGAVWCAVRFFRSETSEGMLAWGFAAMLLSMMVAFLKLWYWLEIQRHSIIREVKRVELQIASLASRLGEGPR
jgi:hypothetical protein